MCVYSDDLASIFAKMVEEGQAQAGGLILYECFCDGTSEGQLYHVSHDTHTHTHTHTHTLTGALQATRVYARAHGTEP